MIIIIILAGLIKAALFPRVQEIETQAIAMVTAFCKLRRQTTSCYLTPFAAHSGFATLSSYNVI